MAALVGNFGNSRKNPHGRTKAARRKATEEGTCVKRDIVYQREKFDKNGQPLGQTIAERIVVNDCFLKGSHFIDDNAKISAGVTIKNKNRTHWIIFCYSIF